MKHSLVSILILVGIVLLFGATRLYNLTSLPVFADEAIYIRWAQLIIDDPSRYAFFSLNDGKTPLFIWMLVPVLTLPLDPLFAGRIVSVVGGIIQGLLLYGITLTLVRSKRAAITAVLFGVLTPFWFFHQRMALMDTWLSVWISASALGLLYVFSTRSFRIAERKATASMKSTARLVFGVIRQPVTIFWIAVSGVSLGAALLTKLPAVLAVPSLLVLVFYSKANYTTYLARLLAVGIAVGLGGSMFLALKLHPAFSQLFARGGDFLHPVSEVLLNGLWKVTAVQSLRLLSEVYVYLSAGFVVALIAGLFSSYRRVVIGLIVSGLLFVAPIFLLGQVIYLRYLLPSMVFLTVAAGLGLHSLFQTPGKFSLIGRVSGLLLILITAIYGLQFCMTAYGNPDGLVLPPSDRTQYQTEWSSGHGVKRATEKLLAESKTKRIFMATEGYFGTLPDGVLMYLHQQNVDAIKVEGIGQPISGFAPSLRTQSAGYDEVWLLVNSHRFSVKMPEESLIEEYCRPFQGPCLQLWNITTSLRND